MLKYLDALREVLAGDARKAMDLLLGRMSGLRKQWETERVMVAVEGCTPIYSLPGPVNQNGERDPAKIMLDGAVAQALKPGDRVLYLWESLAGQGRDAAILWTEAGEQALRSVLAPGWDWSEQRFLCPKCRYRAFADNEGRCRECRKPTHSGAYKVCAACAPLRGECMACPSKVVPAVKGVNLRLGTLNPLRETKDLDPMRVQLRLGEELRLWVAVALAPDLKEPPDIQCFMGTKLDCNRGIYFLVTDPARKEHQLKLGMVQPECPDMGPVKQSRSLSVKVPGDGLAGEKVFSQAGEYAVRVVAGRHISETVAVIVPPEDAGPAEAGGVATAPPAAPPPLPRKQPMGRRYGVTMQGNTVAAEDAGKMVWKVELPFVVGAVTQDVARWTVTSADGAQAAVIDPATGKLMEVRRLRNAPPAPAPNSGAPPAEF